MRQRKIALLRHDRPRGFPAAANAGIHAAKGRDVVLLNSDTLVPPGWLERLRHAAYGAPDIGTVTPLSNDASILSYPGPAGNNPQSGPGGHGPAGPPGGRAPTAAPWSISRLASASVFTSAATV